MAKKRTNIIPVIEDARHPHKYRMLLGGWSLQHCVGVANLTVAGMVDVIFADVAQPDQARIVSINAQHFLKNQGHFVISIKVCVHVCMCLLEKGNSVFTCRAGPGVCVCDSFVRARGRGSVGCGVAWAEDIQCYIAFTTIQTSAIACARWCVHVRGHVHA